MMKCDIVKITWMIRVRSIAVATSDITLARKSNSHLFKKNKIHNHCFNLSKMLLSSYHSTRCSNSSSQVGERQATKCHWRIRKLQKLLWLTVDKINLNIRVHSINNQNNYLENDSKKTTTLFTNLPKKKCSWSVPIKVTTQLLSGILW